MAEIGDVETETTGTEVPPLSLSSIAIGAANSGDPDQKSTEARLGSHRDSARFGLLKGISELHQMLSDCNERDTRSRFFFLDAGVAAA